MSDTDVVSPTPDALDGVDLETWGLGTNTQLSLHFLHQSEDNIPDFGVPIVRGRPAPGSDATRWRTYRPMPPGTGWSSWPTWTAARITRPTLRPAIFSRSVCE